MKLHVGYIESSNAVRLTSAELVQGLGEFGVRGRPLMPPLLPAQGAEGISGACSRSAA